ncbi:glycosyltransferase [Nocardia sp. CA-290969]|uniref:glycosyltransferase n=1 Tax=Nocardia sp. CA-290969 TaxID=3239986 RepID=UPI003D8FA77B
MRIGLIGRAENTGLGIQTWEFARHMHPAKTLVVDLTAGTTRRLYPERFPGAKIIQGIPDRRHLEEFVDGLDVVFTAETPYNYDLFTVARAAGVKTVLQYNFEFLDYLARRDLPRPDLLAAPSPWRYDEVTATMPGQRTMLLPVPVADRVRPPTHYSSRAIDFLHIVGRPAIHDRNGTADLIEALQYVRSEISVTIRCQDPKYVPRLMAGRRLPDHVHVDLEHDDIDYYWQPYHANDVLVLPRRFGGLCLPAQEALASGLPVVMPDISPNNLLLQPDWLVPARRTGSFRARTDIDLHTVDHQALAATIDRFASDPAFFRQAQSIARATAEQLSWNALKPTYLDTFWRLHNGA